MSNETTEQRLERIENSLVAYGIKIAEVSASVNRDKDIKKLQDDIAMLKKRVFAESIAGLNGHGKPPAHKKRPAGSPASLLGG